MREIQLTQGKVALVDDEDYEYLNQWKWYANKHRNTYYVRRNITVRKNGRTAQINIKMHHIIMGHPGKFVVDHINQNGLDNRKCNLRIVTNRQNSWNRLNQGVYPGVRPSLGKYCARAQINNKIVYFGTFDTAEEARDIYLKMVGNL